MRRHALPEQVRRALSEVKESLGSLYGDRLKGVYLYGSYARGDYRVWSDVDVLVVLTGPVKVSEEIRRYDAILSEICLRYDRLISTLPVAEDAFRVSSQSFFKAVEREAVRL
jgi:predicted nucleotidyltransferase